MEKECITKPVFNDFVTFFTNSPCILTLYCIFLYTCMTKHEMKLQGIVFVNKITLRSKEALGKCLLIY